MLQLSDSVTAVQLFSLCLAVTRLEERESDMKKEYNALHQRHTEVGSVPGSALLSLENRGLNNEMLL